MTIHDIKTGEELEDEILFPVSTEEYKKAWLMSRGENETLAVSNALLERSVKRWEEYAHGLEYDIAAERGKRTACEMVIVDLKLMGFVKGKRRRWWLW